VGRIPRAAPGFSRHGVSQGASLLKLPTMWLVGKKKMCVMSRSWGYVSGRQADRSKICQITVTVAESCELDVVLF